eukprot:scaffold151940_cov71-Cyclotella_meneghiniana.AAC.1
MTSMASRASRIAAEARKIFGTLPNRNARSGAQILKKPLVSHYHARWYMEPIEPSARATFPEYTTELQERRTEKLRKLRQRGKGPPKKGSGKRSKCCDIGKTVELRGVRRHIHSSTKLIVELKTRWRIGIKTIK